MDSQVGASFPEIAAEVDSLGSLLQPAVGVNKDTVFALNYQKGLRQIEPRFVAPKSSDESKFGFAFPESERYIHLWGSTAKSLGG
jgi:hypothetical protein